MATIQLKTCTFSKSGSTISGAIEYEVNFTETETRLDVGFQPSITLRPSRESTVGVLTSTETITILGRGTQRTINHHLAEYVVELTLQLPYLRPSGQRTVTVHRDLSIQATQIFKREDVLDKWTQNPGMEIIRLNLALDLGSSVHGDNIAVQRFA